MKLPLTLALPCSCIFIAGFRSIRRHLPKNSPFAPRKDDDNKNNKKDDKKDDKRDNQRPGGFESIPRDNRKDDKRNNDRRDDRKDDKRDNDSHKNDRHEDRRDDRKDNNHGGIRPPDRDRPPRYNPPRHEPPRRHHEPNYPTYPTYPTDPTPSRIQRRRTQLLHQNLLAAIMESRRCNSMESLARQAGSGCVCASVIQHGSIMFV